MVIRILKTSVIVALLTPILSHAADCSANIQAASSIELVGVYASPLPSSRSTGMAYWYDVDLWRVDDCYFGYLTVTNSREGDPPYGILSFRLAPNDNRISFSSKLSMAVRYQGADKPGIPTKDLFEFSGTFNKTQIVGAFTYSDKLSADPSTTQKTRLKIDPKHTLYLSKKGTTFRDWQEDAERTLNFSGPKW